MFRSPVAVQKDITEGYVTAVDIKRYYCSVRTSRGQILTGVSWQLPVGGTGRGGDSTAPTVGERVVISFGLGYPLITGSLPVSATEDSFPAGSIEFGNDGIDTSTDLGGLSAGAGQNAGRPKDFVPGDRVLSSNGGGILAVLRCGSLLVRASRLSQILVSKFDDLIRIVSRNQENFSDVSADYKVNRFSRLFRFVGYFNDLSDSRHDRFKMEQVFGNVDAGLEAKNNPLGPESLPAPGLRIFWERVLDFIGGQPVQKMTHTYELDGAVTRTVTHGDGVTYTRHEGTQWRLNLQHGKYADITVNGTKVVVDFNGESIVTQDSGKVFIDHKGVSTGLFDDDKVVINRGDHGVVTLLDSKAEMTFDGTSYCRLTDGLAEVGTAAHRIIIGSSGVSIS